MKKFNLFVLMILASLYLPAQAPQGIQYQAVVRDNTGQVLANQAVGVRISILQGSVSGSAVYTETSIPSTNAFGLITIEIGSGTTTDNFSSIDWSGGPYFLKVEVDPGGGTTYQDLGTTQLLSVPYALYANRAGNAFSGDYNALANKPDLSGFLTGESDPQFQASVASGITGADTAGWNAKLDSYTETDPVFGASVSSGITGADTAGWNAKLDSYTETDPEVGSNTTNYFSKWDGNALVSGTLYETASHMATFLPFFANGGVQAASLTLNGITKTSWPTGVTSRFAYWAGTDSLASANIFYAAGKTGVATGAPAYTLDVAGTVRAQDTLIADKAVTLGGTPNVTLTLSGDSVVQLGTARNGGLGLFFRTDTNFFGGFYADTATGISLRDTAGNITWYSMNRNGISGNLFFRDGLASRDPAGSEGKIEYQNRGFTLMAGLNSTDIIRFKWAGFNKATLHTDGTLDLLRIRDINNYAYYLTPSGNSNINSLSAQTFLKAPVFRDLNNQNYYLDPAGNSNILGLNAQNFVTSQIFRDANNPSSYFLDPNQTSRVNNLTVVGVLNSAYSIQATNIYSNRFISRYNIGYYLDPASASRLNTVDVSLLRDVNNTSFYIRPSSSSRLNSLDVAIVKDLSNINYYLDPASTSRLGALNLMGNLGVGGNYDPSYRLYVYGNAYSTGGWAGSDIRWKKDVTPLEPELEKVMHLQGVHYKWRKEEFPDRGFDDKIQVGLIAQQVEKVFPELVRTDPDGYKAVSYEKLTVMLLEALKEQQKLIEKQQKSINELREKIERK